VAKLEQEISVLKAALLERPECDVTMINRNNKLTRYFTGIPTYNSFVALVDYLNSKARAMRAWKGSSTSSAEKQYASQQR